MLGGLDSFEPDRSGGFRGWLYAVARHKLVDHFRAGRDEAELPPSLAADLESSRTQDQRAIEQAITLHAALDAIRGDFDAHNWQAFERTVLGHEATADVATDLGTSTSTAAVRQARFRILLRLRVKQVSSDQAKLNRRLTYLGLPPPSSASEVKTYPSEATLSEIYCNRSHSASAVTMSLTPRTNRLARP